MSRLKVECAIHSKDGTADTQINLIGRYAWTAFQLAKAGMKGCTPIDNPAPRWSHYVYFLRGLGFAIETVDEPHGGPFPGHHARYVLHSRITLSGEQIQVWYGNPSISGGTGEDKCSPPENVEVA